MTNVSLYHGASILCGAREFLVIIKPPSISRFFLFTQFEISSICI